MLSVLLAAMLLAAAFPAVAAGSVSIQSAPVGEEFQITTEEHSQNQIEFWGDTLVYGDHRGSQVRVYGFDLGGMSEFPVSITTGTQNNASVYGDIVVHMKKALVWNEDQDDWRDYGDIWAYNMVTGENFPIVVDDAEQGNPFIWGNNIAWVDWGQYGDYDGQIHVYDLEAGEVVHSFEGTGAVGADLESPVLYEDSLVAREYYYSGGSRTRVRLFDLVTGDSMVVPGSEMMNSSIRSPSVWGDWIVWQANYSDVYAYNIVSEETTMVCDTGSGYGADVWNGIVVWEDERDSEGTGSDIYGMYLDTGEEFPICTNESEQARPGIENGTVVWVDERNADLMEIDNADVYGMYLAPHVAEFAGANRYETAAMASRKSFGEGADTVVIATGENWPDALAASGLAGAVGGPVLLTLPDVVPATLAAELGRLGAKDAYLIGGTEAISASVEAYLAALLPGDVTRLGGRDRYETANLVSAEAVAMMDGFGGSAILASGLNPPDAVASSALSAGLGMPLYLTPADALPAHVEDAMADAGVSDVYIVGGTAAVGTAVQTAVDGAFGTVERLSGADRYQTSVAIAEKGVELGLVWDGVGFATGTEFPDALAGGVVQAKNGSVLLLTPGDALNADVAAVIEANVLDIGLVRFYGGPVAISQTVRDAIEALLNTI